MNNAEQNTRTREALLLHLKKMVDAKAKWVECVESDKPLSSLKDEGIILEKLG